MIVNAQRTIYDIDLCLCMRLGKQYNILPNTSLNEKFNLYPEIQVPLNEYPKLKYYTIGIGGNNIIDNGSGFSYSEHGPIDGALFRHIPFIMRNHGDDLSETEKAKYRFRVIEVHDDIEYICYYLKTIQDYDMREYFFKVHTVDDSPRLSAFNTNISTILSPIPKERGIELETYENMEYITKLAKLEFSLFNAELREINNVFNILNLDKKQITEIGVCYGIDFETDEGCTEASCVQTGFHVGVNLDLTISLNTDSSILRSIEIGGTEPLRI